jgi:hypothetical protein
VINYSQITLLQLLTGYLASSFAVPGKIGLFTNTPVITPASVIGDFTEATFPGYARQDLTWGTPYLQPDGRVASVNSAVANFTGGAIVDPEVITGFFLTDGATFYMGADLLRDCNGNPITITMSNLGQVIPILVRFDQANRVG